MFFFFQAEDGIRDWSVTGVQTCALPISKSAVGWMNVRTARIPGDSSRSDSEAAQYLTLGAGSRAAAGPWANEVNPRTLERLKRSEERRVGKEWRARRRRSDENKEKTD